MKTSKKVKRLEFQVHELTNHVTSLNKDLTAFANEMAGLKEQQYEIERQVNEDVSLINDHTDAIAQLQQDAGTGRTIPDEPAPEIGRR